MHLSSVVVGVSVLRWLWLTERHRYQRAFIDFFEDQLVSKHYDLKELLDEFLLGGKEPLINGLISGCELSVWTLATKADT